MSDIREAIAQEVEDYLRPRLEKRPFEGGYDCCGCSTYEQIIEDALRIIREGPE